MEVASRFWFRRNRKAVARFQSKLSFRILQEIHGNKETHSVPAEIIAWINFHPYHVPQLAGVSDYLESIFQSIYFFLEVILQLFLFRVDRGF